MIHHRPIFDVDKIEEHYTKKDAVEISYICTSAILEQSAHCLDIFYRETPHPEFGNRYFGIYNDREKGLMITNADNIENLEFEMIFVNGEYHYSRDRRDFYSVGSVSIDGGRAYTRLVGDISNVTRKTFVIRNGKFQEKILTDETF